MDITLTMNSVGGNVKVEEERIIPMSGSDVSFQTQIPPFRTYLGMALRFQVVSALLIIGGLLTLSDVISLIPIGWLIAFGVLYAIGFLQLIILRSLIQKAKYSVHAAGVVALLAAQLSILNWSYLLTVMDLDLRMLILIATAITNVVLFLCFVKIHSEGGIQKTNL